MSRAHIVCVGDELLSGDTVDVHGAYLARFLTDSGIAVDRITMVSDDYQAILGALAQATARSQLVLVTGGLGPTSDDCTRDALGLLVGQKLEFDEQLWKDIQKTLGRTLEGSNRQQGMRPALFHPLINPSGTAPGLIGEVGGCRVVALPGPPRELRSMIDTHGSRIVESLGAPAPAESVATCFGVKESRLEDALQASVERLAPGSALVGEVNWHTRAEYMRIVLRLTGADESVRDTLIAELREAFGSERIAAGEVTIAATVVRELAEAGLTLCAAESCTGGMLGAAITDIPGSSDVFWGSMVTYADSAKTAVLGISGSTLERHGAVSEQTVVEMAKAVRRMAGADLSVAISGVAGPGGGTAEKPVGTVWIALDAAARSAARSFSFPGDRGRVRRAALTEALLMVRDWVARA